NKAVRGERLTPDQRAQIAASGRSQYEAAAKPAIDRIMSFYGKRAEDAGLNPESVVGNFYLSEEPGSAGAAASATGGAPTGQSCPPGEFQLVPGKGVVPC
ncbi:MAG: hypothetical protein ACREJF_07625, partial [Candidatus Methylomirabilales bacterium]